MRLADLARSPNALAADYTRFGVADRLLLSGHSHQAWPDVALEGQVEALEDAARLVDDKWERSFARADEVRAGFRAWLREPDAELALAPSTHDLVLRFLSALDLPARPRLVTSDGEFHTLRRQLARLGETGIDVVRVASEPADTLAERLADAVDERTAAALVSAVLFETAHVVPHLDELAAACARRGAELLVDAYHALGPMALPVRELGLEAAWVVGGGYKYLQLGEGNCFLRLPAQASELRPVITGWFAEFAALAGEQEPGRVAYGAGASRFAGSTYDPTSHYRAARVFAFFAERGLTPELLHAELPPPARRAPNALRPAGPARGRPHARSRDAARARRGLPGPRLTPRRRAAPRARGARRPVRQPRAPPAPRAGPLPVRRAARSGDRRRR